MSYYATVHGSMLAPRHHLDAGSLKSAKVEATRLYSESRRTMVMEVGEEMKTGPGGLTIYVPLAVRAVGETHWRTV